MSDYLVTPILIQYNFLEELCRETTDILSLDLSDKDRHEQYKMSLLLNFNQFLVDSILLLPGDEAEEMFEKLIPAMETGDEDKTLNILNSKPDFLMKVRSEFINIIKNVNK
ncbi:MAG: hypothetical protein NTV03_03255 [Candidatus Nomurabacteria bacterium]|nr:hypothetical protein [Candidatus Nomurabacteria bacterium]